MKKILLAVAALAAIVAVVWYLSKKKAAEAIATKQPLIKVPTTPIGTSTNPKIDELGISGGGVLSRSAANPSVGNYLS